MKKKIIIILVVMCFNTGNIKAYNYSDWNENYPTNIDECLIESEVRYKWYKEEKNDVEYLKRSEFNNKSYDLNDYIFTDEVVSYEKIDETDDIVVNIEFEKRNYTEDDIYYILFTDFDYTGGLLFSEIEIINEITNQEIDYIIEENNIDLNYLKDGKKDDYKIIDKESSILLKLDKSYNVNDIKTILYYKSNGGGLKSYIYSYAYDKNNILFYKNVEIYICSGCTEIFDYLPTYSSLLQKEIPIYKYREKLYKTFNVERVYEEEYYNQLLGYTKDENDIKTYYRYIIDSFVFVDSNGNLVKDDNYCSKNYCFIKYLNNSNVNNIDNPKTKDNIDVYFIILIVMFLIIIFIVLITEIIKIIKKSRTNKTSSFVEIHKLN